jgi:outer membrane protein assembly factor BamB
MGLAPGSSASGQASFEAIQEGRGQAARSAMIGRRLLVTLGLSICLSVCLSACGHGRATASLDRYYTGCSTATQLRASAMSATESRAASTAAQDDWPQFGYSNQRSNNGPANTGITAATVRQLRCRTVALPGTADSSAIELNGITVKGHRRDVIIVTTSYGHTLAIDANTGTTLWEFTPSDISAYSGSAQFTTASPTADPDHRYVYVATPDGQIHKLSLATGREARAGHWPVRVTLDPTHEKLASPTSIDGSHLIVVTDGYIGDIPRYQGHVVEISRTTGGIQAVFNSLCSNVDHLMHPNNCPDTDSAIWGRAGAVIESNGNVLVATSNGESTETATFNGRTNWSDSVLELSPKKLHLLHNWTPTDQLHLTQDDLDLGSTSPALLPGDLAVQGGKSGLLSLLDLGKLDGTNGPAGPRTGGELQTIAAPGATDVFSQPAVATISGQTDVFVATSKGTEAYRLIDRRLQVAWQDHTPGTSPILAGKLLYVYDQVHGLLLVRSPQTGRQLAALPVGQGHWNSPIVTAGMIVLPTGNANKHDLTGSLEIYSLPGH